MAKEIEREVQSLGKGKLLLIAIIIFIIVPLTIMSLFYFTNENFKFMVNHSLSKAPGFIGRYFSKFPTKEERETQKREVALYLLDLGTKSAADKLIIIQKEDSKLYRDLLKIMMQIDSNKTEEILERIRNISLKKDALTSMIEQIRKDKMKELESKAKYYEKLSLPNAVAEINDELMGGISYKDMGRIIEYMSEKKAAKILKNLDEEVVSRLLSEFESKEKSKKVKDLIQSILGHEKELIYIAQVYNEKKPEELLEDVGNTKKYKIDELSIIYRYMDVIQSAQVLGQVEDKDFIFQLLEQIKMDEILDTEKAAIASDLVRTIKIYQDYYKKVDELTKIYAKMDVEQVGDAIAQLFNSNNVGQRYALENQEVILITDQDLAINILERLNPKKAGEVLDTLDINLVSRISKRFTLPPNQSN